MAFLKVGGKKNLAMTSRNSQNGKQDSSLIHVKHLTESEIQSLRESKRNAYHQMMALN